MEVVRCKDCIHYKVRIRDGHKDCECIDGLFNAKEDDFCSFASTEDNDDAGFDSDYKGVHCEDCAWYDGYLEECVAQNDKGYCGLLDPQPWDYCSRAERRIET